MVLMIQEIEILGFKSYLNKTILKDMDPIFNSITGINGSGKSNILDAICFVLGLSNLLIIRAHKPDDLIFHGKGKNITQAEVRITLRSKNEKQQLLDFKTTGWISVSRQIILGGKNRYFLNNKNVQPSKILNFFYSVNININNPHFLVRQGHIIRVTQMNSKEILELVENGLGTKLYEIKRKLALQTIFKKREKLKEINSLLKNSIKPQINLIKKSNLTFKFYESFLDLNKLLELLKLVYKKKLLEKKKKVEQTKKKNLFKLKGCIIVFRCFRYRFKRTLFLRTTNKKPKNLKKSKEKIFTVDFRKEKALYILVSLVNDFKRNFEIIEFRKEKFEKNQKKKSEKEKNLFFFFLEKKFPKEVLPRKEINFIRRSSFTCHFLPRLIFLSCFLLKKFLQGVNKKLKNQKNFWGLFLKKKEKGLLTFFFLILKKTPLRFSSGNEKPKKKKVVFFFKKNKKKTSCILFLSDLWKISESTVIWDLRKFIKGTITSSIQIKYSKMTTAFEFLGGKFSNFLIVKDQNASKKILENGGLKRELFIIPLDKICIYFRKNFQEKKNRECSFFLSFEKSISKAVHFILRETKIANNLSEAKKIAFSERKGFCCVTLEGEIFEPSGSIITGKNNGPSITHLGLCSEINNFKEKFLRLGIIIRKLKKTNFSHSQIAFTKKSKKEIIPLFQKNFKLKEKKNEVGSYIFVFFSVKKNWEFVCFLFLKNSKQKLSQLEKKNFFYFGTLFSFLFSKETKIPLKARKVFSKGPINLKKIQNFSYKIWNSIKNFLKIGKILKGKIHIFQICFKICFEIFCFLFTLDCLLLKKNQNFNDLFDLGLKFFNFFSKSIHRKRISQIKKGKETYKSTLKHLFEPKNASFFLKKLYFKLKKKKNSRFFLQNSSRAFNVQSIKFAVRSSKKYQDLIRKRATVEKDRLIIEDIIEKLDFQKIKILKQSIRKINFSFSEIFKLLIPGLSARLVSIRSKKGSWKGLGFSIYLRESKKKTIKELSGGQKSILALSLIFSILISRPVPFYILDEIDAALDICYTENIGKIIKKNLNVSQFIVVSLKKGIVENANVVFKVKSFQGKSFVSRIEKKLGKGKKEKKT